MDAVEAEVLGDLGEAIGGVGYFLLCRGYLFVVDVLDESLSGCLLELVAKRGAVGLEQKCQLLYRDPFKIVGVNVFDKLDPTERRP